ncbi:hypothetical protein [Streptomyces megasporus]|uniref:hypothetical protein n=1 Tax=Streptomyces megasporus TaxID=44060 RepID=UPI0004E18509|nr:hypothetical protein [Streptomyces megasporus]
MGVFAWFRRGSKPAKEDTPAVLADSPAPSPEAEGTAAPRESDGDGPAGDDREETVRAAADDGTDGADGTSEEGTATNVDIPRQQAAERTTDGVGVSDGPADEDARR